MNIKRHGKRTLFAQSSLYGIGKRKVEPKIVAGMFDFKLGILWRVGNHLVRIFSAVRNHPGPENDLLPILFSGIVVHGHHFSGAGFAVLLPRLHRFVT